MLHRLLRMSLAAAVFFALAPSARGGTFEANLVIGWAHGIVANGDGKIVSKNRVSLSNQTGITAHAGTIVGNITSGNLVGISVAQAASAFRNGIYGNAGGLGIFKYIQWRRSKEQYGRQPWPRHVQRLHVRPARCEQLLGGGDRTQC